MVFSDFQFYLEDGLHLRFVEAGECPAGIGWLELSGGDSDGLVFAVDVGASVESRQVLV